uniref:t-SNARE coiled-coil homology domain-containing protein n=1 Tax=Paramoeba aestuarina TaxID=180227 RepID=A0A7S4KVI7_9EUKA
MDLGKLQKQKMKEQDTQVEMISESLGTTHKVAVAIGDELDIHGDLLEEMKQGVSHTTGRVQDENVKITKLEEKASLTKWYVGLGVQSIVLVVLMALNILKGS